MEAIRQRYHKAKRLDKTKILDEFCAVCHYHRQYALRKLGTVLNGLFRPQVLLSQSFNASKFEVTGIGSQQSYVQIWEGLKGARDAYLRAKPEEKASAFEQYKEAVNKLFVQAKRKIPAPLITSTSEVVKKQPPFSLENERTLLLELERHIKAPAPVGSRQQREIIPERDVALLWIHHIMRVYLRLEEASEFSKKSPDEWKTHREELVKKTVLNQSKLDTSYQEVVLQACRHFCT